MGAYCSSFPGDLLKGWRVTRTRGFTYPSMFVFVTRQLIFIALPAATNGSDLHQYI